MELIVEFHGSKFIPNSYFLVNAKLEARENWAKLLISKDFPRQIYEMMYDGVDGFCCLGVGSSQFRKVHTMYNETLPYLNSRFAMSLSMASGWAEEYRDYFTPNSLEYNPIIAVCIDNDEPVPILASSLNDDYKMPFKLIAKLICPELFIKS